MEPDYFGSFVQSGWLSIFVVHEMQLRPRCIMESANGSLRINYTLFRGRTKTYELCERVVFICFLFKIALTSSSVLVNHMFRLVGWDVYVGQFYLMLKRNLSKDLAGITVP